ncbi:MAG TPA: CoA pyrophosphatase [Ktedonobacteraceae bacterium]|nr:CoA pyrophosphatase [Ktedonobacteraceae bacterium]
MTVQNTPDIVSLLRNRLEPVERAGLLSDMLEGQRPHARKAAVLLGLFEREGQTCLVFIRRSSSLRTHGGEIAFPGGGAESTDSSLVMTALREAQEEIGLDPANVEVLGVLHPVFTVVSNYLVVPVVAFLPQGLGMMRLQASEVTEIILAPLHKLADPTIFHTEKWTRDRQARTIYFYDYGSYRIWGVTARVLNDLLTVIYHL